MKDSFLGRVAEGIINSGKPLEQCCVVFPTKRAAVYFKRELSQLIHKPTWMPELCTMDEWLTKAAGINHLDTLTQAIYLHECYQKITGLEEGFVSFYHWGNMLLSDFNDMDANLVDAAALLKDLSIQAELDYSFAEYLEPEQWELIQKFWKNSSPEKNQAAAKFLVFWQQMLPIYEAFNAKLDKEGNGYLGKIQKKAWGLIAEAEQHHYEYTWFVGFNNLSKCAWNAMRKTVERGSAYCFWDADDWYFSNLKQSETGRFLRKYAEDAIVGPGLKEQIQHILKPGMNLAESEKDIKIVHTAELSSQAQVAATELNNWLTNQFEKDEEVAVILPKAGMLQSVLHSLPQSLQKLNLTLQYPLRESALFRLVEIVAELQKNAIEVKGEVRVKKVDMLALLSHPYTGFKNAGLLHELRRTVVKKHEQEDVSAFINANDLLRLNDSEHELLKNFLEAITTPIGKGRISNPIEYLYEVLVKLYDVLKGENEQAYGFETELIYASMTQLITLKQKLVAHAVKIDSKELFEIAIQVIQDVSLPFTGEPLEGSQIMGFLETQALDFEKVIIVGCTEGQLPPSVNNTGSFIPYNLRKAYRMTLPEDAEARYAYLFYRLFHKAKEIVLVHADTSDDFSVAEPSRYLGQLHYLFGWEIPTYLLSNEMKLIPSVPFQLPNQKKFYEDFLSRFVSNSETKSKLSPTSINTWLDCRLKFYLNSIMKIRPLEGFNAEMDAAQLGNIFHKTLNEIYLKAMIDGIEVTPRYIDDSLQLVDDLVHGFLVQYVPLGGDEQQQQTVGMNAVQEALICEYVKKVLAYDRKRAQKSPFRILGLEMEVEYNMPIRLPNGNTEYLKIGGTIDRLDYANGCLEILDYKTGSDKTDDIKLSLVLDNNYRAKYHIKAAVQLILYGYILGNQSEIKDRNFRITEEMPIKGGLLKLKDIIAHKEFYEHYLSFSEGNQGKTLTALAEIMMPSLEAELVQLLSAETEILPTKNAEHCKYCNYKTLCQR